jgi:hypothetical protein
VLEVDHGAAALNSGYAHNESARFLFNTRADNRFSAACQLDTRLTCCGCRLPPRLGYDGAKLKTSSKVHKLLVSLLN